MAHVWNTEKSFVWMLVALTVGVPGAAGPAWAGELGAAARAGDVVHARAIDRAPSHLWCDGDDLSGDEITALSWPEHPFPGEGITRAPNGDLFVSDVSGQGTWAVGPDGTSPGWIMRIDAVSLEAEVLSEVHGNTGLAYRDGILWSCNFGYLFGVRAHDGREVAAHLLPEPADPIGGWGLSRCNDLTFDDEGNLYASDSNHGRILRVARADLRSDSVMEVWVGQRDADGERARHYFDGEDDLDWQLNGIAYYDGAIYSVGSLSREFYRFGIGDEGQSMGTEVLIEGVPATPEGDYLLGSMDGLKALGDGSFLVIVGPWLESWENALARLYLEDGAWRVEEVARNDSGSWSTFTLHQGSAYLVETNWFGGPLGVDVVPLCDEGP